MSKLYEKGRSFFDLEDYAKALEIYAKGDSEGDIYCSFGLAQLLNKGWGIEKDEERANKLFTRVFPVLKKEAEKQNRDAEFRVGVMYDNGYGVALDKAKAAYWFERAATQGISAAQFNLGLMYKRGDGIEINFEKSAKWMLLSAEQENRDAQWLMGDKYLKGEGVEKSIEKAIYWLEKAALNGRGTAAYEVGSIYEEDIKIGGNIDKAVSRSY